MMTARQIVRHASQRRFRLLAERLLQSAKPAVSRHVVRALTSPWAAGPVALGLAVQRLTRTGDLKLADGLVGRLLDMQQSDGRFANFDDEPDHREHADDAIAPTGVAIAGLLAWQRNRTDTAGSCLHNHQSDVISTAFGFGNEIGSASATATLTHPPDTSERLTIHHYRSHTIDAAIRRGLDALAASQRHDGLLGNGLTDSTVAVWQLSNETRFRQAIDFFDFVKRMQQTAAPQRRKRDDAGRALSSAA